MQLNEADLVQRAQKGDMDAFAELVVIHQRFVYNLAIRAVNSPAEAEDIAQEALIRAWQGLPRFRGQAQFRTWLYRIVVNLCYNRLPHLKQELAMIPVEGTEDLPDTSSRPAASPRESIERDERRRFLHDRITQLPNSMRMMLLMRYQQDMPYEEIAAVLDMPLGTVKTGLYRAKMQLREALDEYEHAEVIR